MLLPVVVDLGGKKRTLVCDLGSWAAMEDYGYKIDEVMVELAKTGRLSKKLVLVLVASMLWKDKATLDDVGAWVGGANYVAVMEGVGKALRQAFPVEASEEANPPRSGTGKRPSSSARTAA